jgi:hypothetical protein
MLGNHQVTKFIPIYQGKVYLNKYFYKNKCKQYIIYILTIMVVETVSTKCLSIDIKLDLVITVHK